MANAVEGLICVAVGCLLIFLNKSFAYRYVRIQRRLLGFDPGRRGVGRGRAVALFMGTVFVLLGVSLLSFPSIGRF